MAVGLKLTAAIYPPALAVAAVLGAMAAVSNLVGTAPEADRATVAAVVRDAFGAAVTPLALGARIV